MPSRVYQRFEEVEKEITELAPPVVYKYRTWSSDLHKSLLTNRTVWFSHPYDLNDELDARPPYKFILSEIESDAFFNRLLETVPGGENMDDQEKYEVAKKKWESIKKDPQTFFDENRKLSEKREQYDQIGIFSTSSSEIEDKIWDLYGGDHTGYAVGFKTTVLSKQLNVSIGDVIYSDDPFPYSMLGKHDGFDVYRYKKTSWDYEKEFRFFTAGIDIYTTRARNFSVEAVAEIIIGMNASKETETEILAIVNAQFPKDVPVYKITKDASGNFVRNELVR